MQNQTSPVTQTTVSSGDMQVLFTLDVSFCCCAVHESQVTAKQLFDTCVGTAWKWTSAKLIPCLITKYPSVRPSPSVGHNLLHCCADTGSNLLHSPVDEVLLGGLENQTPDTHLCVAEFCYCFHKGSGHKDSFSPSNRQDLILLKVIYLVCLLRVNAEKQKFLGVDLLLLWVNSCCGPASLYWLRIKPKVFGWDGDISSADKKVSGT